LPVNRLARGSSSTWYACGRDDESLAPNVFTLAGRLDDGTTLPPVSVPAARFSAMAWVAEAWGRRASVSAGLAARDQLREALQLFSTPATTRFHPHP
jgi:hypothetical protein